MSSCIQMQQGRPPGRLAGVWGFRWQCRRDQRRAPCFAWAGVGYAQSLAPDRRSAQSKVIEMMRPKLALPAEVTP